MRGSSQDADLAGTDLWTQRERLGRRRVAQKQTAAGNLLSAAGKLSLLRADLEGGVAGAGREGTCVSCGWISS